MSDSYDVLGGHENAEFRQHDDGSIELYSTEEDPETEEEIGHVGDLSEAELRDAGETLRTVVEDDEAVGAPSFENIDMGQHPLTGAILMVSVEDGERNTDKGAAFDDPQDIIEAADSLDG